MKKILSVLSIAASLTWSLASQAAGLTPQDHAEIQQLYARYNHAIDAGDANAWADTFTADGVFNNNFKGREGQLAFMKMWVEKMNGTQRRHWNSNLQVSGDGKTAKGSVYLMLWDISQKPAVVAGSGMYADSLVKTKQGWRFTARVVNLDAPAAPAAQPAAK